MENIAKQIMKLCKLICGKQLKKEFHLILHNAFNWKTSINYDEWKEKWDEMNDGKRQNFWISKTEYYVEFKGSVNERSLVSWWTMCF